jgi:hypothetical protein
VHQTTETNLAIGMRMERRRPGTQHFPWERPKSPDHQLSQTYLGIGMKMEQTAARYSASPMGGTHAPDHPDLLGNGHEDGVKGGHVLSASNWRSSPTDHPVLPGNGHEDGVKGGQVLSVSHGRVQCPRPPRLTN